MRELLLGTTLLFCGCGYVGDPLPPALNIPEKITDLRVVQRADRLLIDFTIPKLTTEGLPIRKLGGIDLRVGSAAIPVQLTEGRVQAIAPATQWYGQEITVRVRLLNFNGRPSEWSNEVAVTIAQALAAPVELRVTPHIKGMAVTWKAPQQDKLQFRVFRRTAEENQPALIATVDGPEHIDATVEFGKRYEYSVQSLLGSAESELTTPMAAAARDIFAPNAPAGLNAVTSLDSIELGWERNAEPDLAYYRVYRGEADGALMLLADMVENPVFSDRQVTSGRTYRYAISAVDRAGNEGERTAAIQSIAP